MADRTSTKRKKVKKASLRVSAAVPRRKTSKSPPSRKVREKGGATARPAQPTGKHFLSDKVGHFTESVIREMTRQAMLHGAVNLAQGFPDFSSAGGDQTGCAAGDCSRREPIRHYLGREEPAKCDCAADGRLAGHHGRSGKRDHCVLRIDRSNDFDAVGGLQCGRRSRDLRAVLRELWARLRV